MSGPYDCLLCLGHGWIPVDEDDLTRGTERCLPCNGTGERWLKMVVHSPVPEAWTLVTDRPPVRGERVEVSRDGKTKLDELCWYPDIGNWNVEGMYWRKAS